MSRLLLTLGIGLMMTMGFAFTGCRSPQMELRNPFASKPKADIKSPVEMDDINLKAPPERYTKDENLNETGKRIQKESLAQQGSYRSSSAPEVSSTKTAERSERLAMTEDSRHSSSGMTAKSGGTNKGDASYDDGGYETAPTSGHTDVPGFDTYSDEESSGSMAPFAPGSIGDY